MIPSPGRSKDERLTSRERIKRRREFQQVYDHGARVRGRLLTLFVLPNGLTIARLGIAATRKLGGAVRRNRAKRLVREAFRRLKPSPGLDVVVVPQPDLFNAAFSALEADFCSALARTRRTRVR